MKRCYLCAMVLLLCLLALSGSALAQTGSINGIFYIDLNGDRSYTGESQTQTGDSLLYGAIVELYRKQGQNYYRVDSTATDLNGRYSFLNLGNASDYYVKFLIPEDLKYNYEFLIFSGDDREIGFSDVTSTQGYTDAIRVNSNGDQGDNVYNIDGGLKIKETTYGSITGTVWEGINNNGSKEHGEGKGVKDVVVKAYECGNNNRYAGEGITKENGTYTIDNLITGLSYKVRFEPAAGYSLVDKGTDSDPDSSSKTTECSSNTLTTSGLVFNAGVFKPSEGGNPNGQINGRLWLDANHDGAQGGIETEPGIGNWMVRLLNSQKIPVDSTTTDSSNAGGQKGRYSFTKLELGTYYLQFVKNGDYSFTDKNAANNDESDSDVNPETGITDALVIDHSDASEEHIDAGVFEVETPEVKGSIGNYVWNDRNKNGIQDEGGSPGIEGVKVLLYLHTENGDTKTDSAATNVSGYYKFNNVPAGIYRVKFNLIAGYTQFTVKGANLDYDNNSDADPANGFTVPFTLLAGENRENVDAGMIEAVIPPEKGSIGDFVWNDIDQDGVQDKGEPGMPNVMVEIYKWGSNITIMTDITDHKGFYLFDNLEPGTYYVKFILPEGFTFTKKNQDPDDALDSDADRQTGKSEQITLDGEDNLTIDAGLYGNECVPASLGDFVWNDCNRNGIQDVGESGIGGVELKLHLCTGSHTNPGDPCAYGNVVASAKTDKNGKYMFFNIMPGYYFIEIVLPCSFTITKPDQTEDFKDSDIIPSLKHTACIKVNPGETNLTVDAGLYPTPPATIGDLVWIDANKNGIQDNGEKGLCNVMVELYMCGVSKAVAAAKTDNEGKYIFRDVIPNTSYSVKFYLPKGYAFTLPDQGGSDNFDSDVCPKNNGMTKFYDITPDEVNLTIDCGMYLSTTSACSYVWKDNNNNGVKDEGEAGMQGVTVELFKCSNNTLVQSAKTDASGIFTFNDILLESYYLKILVPDGYKIGKASPEGGAQTVNADFGTNGQSTCFDVADSTTSIGRPVALVLSTTGITRGAEIPTEFTLQQNYPNPFNPSTTIEFAVPNAGQYTIKVFNMLGQEIATLLDRELPIGYHMVVFDASKLTSGMYIYRLSGNNVVIIKKMMLSK